MKKTGKRNRTTFTLKIQNIDELDIKYGFNKHDNFKCKNSPINKTNLSDLSSLNKSDVKFSFYDESKKIHSCHICMVDKDSNTLLEKKTNILCFWCKHTFDNIPIGCPIRYNCPQIYKQYYSEITKDKYSITEDITIMDHDNIEKQNKKKTVKLDKKFYYETTGIFCSFNCCLSYIKDNFKNPLYNNSELLLSKIYKELFDIDINIKPSPNWTLLKSYGGPLTIEEFRDSNHKVQFEDLRSYITKIPKQISLGSLYEEKIKF